jgi:UDP-N-acetylglucosamine--N-acetylmuramyl-(pentapeptide) pyrophosphoryl-undecaprenol N-acetylglucosamine transferase
MNPPRFVFACGGTSGHINPALAIAEQVRADCPGAEIRFYGTERGLEHDVVPRAGFSMTPIRARGFPSRLSMEAVSALLDYFAGRRQCRRLLREFQPDAVIGTGGYVAGPVASAAQGLHIPVLLHEQNAFPGRANKLLARHSQVVCISFPGSERYFPKGTPITLTGNPVREVFFSTTRESARRNLGLSNEQPFILAYGGSQGARTINEAVLGLNFSAGRPAGSGGNKPWPPAVVLAAGKRDHDRIVRGSSGKSWLTVAEYLHDIHLYMAAADLVICRAGASTCAELAALGRPSILVPYPYAAGGHQDYNARAMAEAGAALVCHDADFNPDWLAGIINEMFSDSGRLETMGRAAAGLACPDAAAAICRRLYEVMR